MQCPAPRRLIETSPRAAAAADVDDVDYADDDHDDDDAVDAAVCLCPSLATVYFTATEYATPIKQFSYMII